MAYLAGYGVLAIALALALSLCINGMVHTSLIPPHRLFYNLWSARYCSCSFVSIGDTRCVSP